MNNPDENPFAPFPVIYNAVDDSVSGAINFTAHKCNVAWVSIMYAYLLIFVYTE